MNLCTASIFAFAFAALITNPASGATTSFNTGSLGSAADGTNADSVTFTSGVVAAGGDQAALYGGISGSSTVVPFLPALNPSAGSPFTIEFWANPASTDNDDSPVSNRLATATNRSGWVFFQRAEATGWNFRMYNGVGSGLGWDLTGGTSTLNSWSHVVATWNGSAALLYVNGVLVDSTNEGGLNGAYNPNTAAGTNLFAAATDTGSPYNGAVDEIAFYGSALSAIQIAAHFGAAASATPDAYYSLIQNDGALLQLSNVPEPSAALMIGLAALTIGGRRTRRR